RQLADPLAAGLHPRGALGHDEEPHAAVALADDHIARVVAALLRCPRDGLQLLVGEALEQCHFAQDVDLVVRHVHLVWLALRYLRRPGPPKASRWHTWPAGEVSELA